MCNGLFGSYRSGFVYLISCTFFCQLTLFLSNNRRSPIRLKSMECWRIECLARQPYRAGGHNQRRPKVIVIFDPVCEGTGWRGCVCRWCLWDGRGGTQQGHEVCSPVAAGRGCHGDMIRDAWSQRGTRRGLVWLYCFVALLCSLASLRVQI